MAMLLLAALTLGTASALVGPPPIVTLAHNLYDTGAGCRPIYGQARDADHDGLCDASELELARRVAPVLKLADREPLLQRMRTIWQVHDAGRGEVVVSYVQTWVADISPSHGATINVNHPGDTEEVRYWLLSRDGGLSFRLVRARYWHHTSRQEWAQNDVAPGTPLETVQVGDEVHPVVWVQQNAHGSYLDRETCARDPEGDGEPCGDGLSALAPVTRRGNVGEAGAPLLGEDGDPSAPVHMAELGFPGESAWSERHNGFGVRGFCGGLAGTDWLGTIAHLAGENVWYRRRVFGPVCAGPLGGQWDRRPAGTEDIIYWRGFHSTRIAPERGRTAVAGETVYLRVGTALRALSTSGGPTRPMPAAALGGDPAAVLLGGAPVLAYARAGDQRVLVRTADGTEHPAPLVDREVALAAVGSRLFVVTRQGWAESDDGGRTFGTAIPLPGATAERPAAAALGGRLLLAWRGPGGGLVSYRAGDATPRPLGVRGDHAPWAVESAYDGGAVYLFTTDHGHIRYFKLSAGGSLAKDPVEIPDAWTRSGGAATAIGNRITLIHDAASGLFVRQFDPDL
jgi:hypothetical protein